MFRKIKNHFGKKKLKQAIDEYTCIESKLSVKIKFNNHKLNSMKETLELYERSESEKLMLFNNMYNIDKIVKRDTIKLEVLRRKITKCREELKSLSG